jgi:hypothetical protein
MQGVDEWLGTARHITSIIHDSTADLTAPVYDARYQGMVKVEYPLHRLFGRECSVIRKARKGDVAFLELDADGKSATVARWMTVSDECQYLTCGYDPFCSWEALQALLTLLDDRGV